MKYYRVDEILFQQMVVLFFLILFILDFDMVNVIIVQVLEVLVVLGCCKVVFMNVYCVNVVWCLENYVYVLCWVDYILFDGIGIEIVLKFVCVLFIENFNGMDFGLCLMEVVVKKGFKVYMLGGEIGIVECVV